MKYKRPALFLALITLLLVISAAAVVLAQTSPDYNLEWHVLAGGGSTSTSAAYHVKGTIGQSIAGQPEFSSAAYTAGSGYWFVDPQSKIYMPAVSKN